jgi:AraC-like DNA-binding protein
MEPPWCLRGIDGAPLSLYTLTSGEASVVQDGGSPVHVRPGDVVVMRGTKHYTIADDLSTPPQVIIHPGQRCATVDGRELIDERSLGVRTWGDRGGSTQMLIGVYEKHGEVSNRLLSALPSLIVVPDRADDPLLRFLNEEIGKDSPGQEVVLDRLLDVILVDVLRTWFALPETNAPAWYTAAADPTVGEALQLLHNQPDVPWTVEGLAAEVGLSRAAFARRFAELVGEPPMSYLTAWRLTLAADLLREPDVTIETVARRVGYGSAFALSTAFKRERGISPREHRAGNPADQPVAQSR